MFKKALHLTIVLFTVTFLSGLILSFVFDVTKEPIATVEKQRTEEGIKAIYDDFTGYNDLSSDIDGNNKNILSIYEVVKDSNIVGYVYKINAPGSYSGKLEFLVGINGDGKIQNLSFLSLQETPGLGTKVKNEDFYEQFIGKTTSSVDNIDTITGATISSKAVINGVDLALNHFNANYSN